MTRNTDAPYPQTTGAEPCRTGNPDRFFPELGVNATTMQALKAECRPGPVREQCLRYALHIQVAGVWGGTTPEERKTLSRKQGIKQQPMSFKDLAPASPHKPGHGSWSGVNDHRKKFEANCQQCREFATRQSRVARSDKARGVDKRLPTIRSAERTETECPDCGKGMTKKSLPKHRRDVCAAAKASA